MESLFVSAPNLEFEAAPAFHLVRVDLVRPTRHQQMLKPRQNCNKGARRHNAIQSASLTLSFHHLQIFLPLLVAKDEDLLTVPSDPPSRVMSPKFPDVEHNSLQIQIAHRPRNEQHSSQAKIKGTKRTYVGANFGGNDASKRAREDDPMNDFEAKQNLVDAEDSDDTVFSEDLSLPAKTRKRIRNRSNKAEKNWTMAMKRHWNTAQTDKTMTTITIKRTEMHTVLPPLLPLPRTWESIADQCELLLMYRRITDCMKTVWSSLRLFDDVKEVTDRTKENCPQMHPKPSDLGE
jgi:hypothetical protein